jgi:hypothetical protein
VSSIKLRILGYLIALIATQAAIGSSLSPAIDGRESDEGVEEHGMAFVNEYASDDDVERYGLREIWDKYHPMDKGEYFYGRKAEWTVDRDNQAFLMLAAIGIREDSNKLEFLLWLNGTEVIASLTMLPGSSARLDDDPFVIVWGLNYLRIKKGIEIPKEQILDVLKSALSTYGYWGIRHQIPNTEVRFHF